MTNQPLSNDDVSAWQTVLSSVLGHSGAARGMTLSLQRHAAVLAGATVVDMPDVVRQLLADGLGHLGPEDWARLHALLPQPSANPRPAGFAVTDELLPRLAVDGVPGISLVTCCGNRNENLLRALPSWLAQEAISEVVIVDWSSDVPVIQSLQTADVADPRIRILRVEDEPAWVLTHAFNAGFRVASCATILKTDADIVLSADFLLRNLPSRNGFLAGNWRTAGQGQEYVNGSFMVGRQALAEVGGFNEQLRGYGWDDEDLYQRLTQLGLRRIDLAHGSVAHLDHDDPARTGTAEEDEPRTALQEARRGPIWMIRRNRYVAAVMPEWNGRRAPAAFRVVSAQPDLLVVRRQPPDTSAVPPHVQAAAELHATIERAAWAFGPEIRDMLPDDALRLLDQPLTRTGALLARYGRFDLATSGAKPLFLRIDDDVLRDAGANTLSVLRAVAERARALGLLPVAQTETATLPQPVAEALGDVPVLPLSAALGPTSTIVPRLLFDLQEPPGDAPLRLRLSSETVQRLSLFMQRAQKSAAPGAPR